MNAELPNLILTQLRDLRNDIATLRTETSEGFSDMRARISSLEVAMVGVRRDINHGEETDARQQISLDRIVGRIERRLDLVDAP